MGIEPTHEILLPQRGVEDRHAHQLRKCFHLLKIIPYLGKLSNKKKKNWVTVFQRNV